MLKCSLYITVCSCEIGLNLSILHEISNIQIKSIHLKQHFKLEIIMIKVMDHFYF